MQLSHFYHFSIIMISLLYHNDIIMIKCDVELWKCRNDRKMIFFFSKGFFAENLLDDEIKISFIEIISLSVIWTHLNHRNINCSYEICSKWVFFAQLKLVLWCQGLFAETIFEKKTAKSCFFMIYLIFFSCNILIR